MNLQPVNEPGVKKKKSTSAGFGSTIILLLLIGIAVMGFMTAKRYFEAQQTTPQQLEVKELTDYVNEYPENIQGRLALAYAFQTAERYDEAREQYLEIISVSPKEQGAWYNLGEIARINEDYKDAESRLTQLLKDNKNHLLGSISLGRVYIETKQYDKAIAVVDEMLKITPHIADLHYIKAQAYAKKGNKPEAKASYEQVLKYDPTNQFAQKGLADLK